MPINVPKENVPKVKVNVPKIKVPPYYYQTRDVEKIDLFDRLHRERAVFLFQEIDSTVANRIIGTIFMLDIENYRKDIYLFINSRGGEIMQGLSLYDTIRFSRPDIQTIGLGFVASTASLLLARGSFSKRIAFPTTRVMLRRPRVKFSNDRNLTPVDLLDEMEQVETLYEITVDLFAKRTGQNRSTIVQDIEKGTFFSAREARDYGLIDDVIAEGRIKKRNIYREYLESRQKKKKGNSK